MYNAHRYIDNLTHLYYTYSCKEVKPYRLQKGENMEDMKEFVAYARKLLRVINKIEKYLENGESEKALELVRELKEDTQKDIEA